jgi:hypothetical protein
MQRDPTMVEIAETTGLELITREEARAHDRAAIRKAKGSGVVYAKPVWNADHASQIETMIGLGLTPIECAEVLKLQHIMLERVYKREISVGIAKVKITVGQALMKVAKDPTHPKQVDAAKFVLARRGGANWQEPVPEKNGETNGGEVFIFNTGKIERDI